MERYEAYKDSGIMWLGKIPEHWEERRFSFLFTFSRGLPISKQDLKDKGIPCVNYGEIHSKFGFEVNPEINSLKCVDKEYLSTSNKSLLRQGDIVFADTSEDIEGAGNFTCLEGEIPTFAGYHTIIVKQKKNEHYRYLAYFFDSDEFRAQIRSEVKGIKVFSITQDILKNTRVLLPPLPEQEAIASYLDRKTRQIDELIAKKERLIELKKEERAAIINHAVTKGLDPDVPMKDSGIEWLGEIPEHWELKSLKRVCDINPQKSEIASSKAKNVVFLSMEKVGEDGSYDSSEVSTLDELINGYTYFRIGDVLLAKITPCFENGKGAYLSDLPTQIGFGSTEFHVIRPIKGKANGQYIYYLTQSELYRKLGESYMTGAAGQKRVPTSYIENYKLPIPPISEQNATSEYIRNLNIGSKRIVGKLKRQIDLLKEYKTTLISEAVTGRIKVS